MTGIIMTLLAGGIALAGIMIGRAMYQSSLIAIDLHETPDCQYPCWMGITPGKTPFAAANDLILKAGYNQRQRPFSGPIEYTPLLAFTRCEVHLIVIDNIVVRLRLANCPPTRLGDLIQILGQPKGIIADRFAMVFSDGKLLVYAQRILCEQRFTPDTFIGMIDFLSDDQRVYSVYPWQGFVDLRRYMSRNVSFQC
ncbi:MAG TPA: hypothetical protein VHL11_23525 [Phototrophicaceae bacterium]|nr:hypothetical protein [Phototrophicaceae bacterium]